MAQKLEPWEVPFAPPKRIMMKDLNGRWIEIILNANRACALDYAAIIKVGDERIVVDRDVLTACLSGK